MELLEGILRSLVSSCKLVSKLSCRWEEIRNGERKSCDRGINDTTLPLFSICALAPSDRHLACVRAWVCVYWFNVCLALSDRWHWMWLMSILQHCEIWNMRTAHILGLFLLHLSFNPRNIQITGTSLTNIHQHFVFLTFSHQMQFSQRNFSHLLSWFWVLQILKDGGEYSVQTYWRWFYSTAPTHQVPHLQKACSSI